MVILSNCFRCKMLFTLKTVWQDQDDLGFFGQWPKGFRKLGWFSFTMFTWYLEKSVWCNFSVQMLPLVARANSTSYVTVYAWYDQTWQYNILLHHWIRPYTLWRNVWCSIYSSTQCRNPIKYDCTRKNILPFLRKSQVWLLLVKLALPGKWPALPWEVVRDRVPHREVTFRVWAFASRVWAHFLHRVIPSISQGGSKCPSWCSHTLYPLSLNTDTRSIQPLALPALQACLCWGRNTTTH